jgi:hypothetical protein
MIEVMGKACMLGVHIPLVQHLFSQFVIPESVVRESLDLALDVELPFSHILPVQIRKLRAGKQRLARTARGFRNENAPPGLIIGKRTKAYSKPHEVFFRWHEQDDRTAMLPGHMQDWQPWHGTRIEFTLDEKSLPGQAHILSSAKKDWNMMALADLRRLQPDTIESHLAWDTKRWGFACHRPSRDEIKKKLKRFDKGASRTPYQLMDVVDLWVYRQGKARNSEKIAQVMVDGLYQELVRIKHEFKVGEAVESTLADREMELRKALTPPFGTQSRELWTTGRLVKEPPGIVTWQHKSKFEKQSRRIEEQWEPKLWVDMPNQDLDINQDNSYLATREVMQTQEEILPGTNITIGDLLSMTYQPMVTGSCGHRPIPKPFSPRAQWPPG